MQWKTRKAITTMILPTMSEDEIRQEINKDSLEIISHIRQCIEKFKKTNKNRLPRMYPTLGFYRFKTKRNNDILLLLDAEEYKHRNCPHYGVYFLTKTLRGLTKVYQCANFGDEDQDIIVFTNHFIQRYNERMKLCYLDPIDVLKHFITHNAGSMITFDEENPQMFYGTTPTGMVFGISKDNGFAYHTTFVNNKKLFDNQTEFVNAIKEEVNLSDIRDIMKKQKENKLANWNKVPIPKLK